MEFETIGLLITYLITYTFLYYNAMLSCSFVPQLRKEYFIMSCSLRLFFSIIYLIWTSENKYSCNFVIICISVTLREFIVREIFCMDSFNSLILLDCYCCYLTYKRHNC